LGLDCVEWVWPRFQPIAPVHSEYLSGLCFLDHLEENEAAELIKDAVSLPEEGGFLVFLLWVLVLEMDLPELLRDEPFDLLVTLHYKAQGGELAWAVANDALSLRDLSEQ